MFLFEKLEVYQRAVAFAQRCSDLSRGFPRSSWYLADHLNRAGLSISLNIAEGSGRGTQADRRNFFIVARGSVHECIPLIELSRRKNLIQESVCRQLRDEVQSIAKMLSGLIAHTKRAEPSRDERR